MKIANVLTASVVFAAAALLAQVGCSSPTSAPIGGSNSADTGDKKSSGDDDSSSNSSNSSTPASSTTTTTTTTGSDGGTSTGTGSEAACLSCVGASSKAAAMIKCQDSCSENDDNCFENCFTQSCGSQTDGTDACTPDLNKCSAQCGDDDDDDGQQPTQAQIQACDSCVASANAQAGNYVTCSDKCAQSSNSESAFDQCDDQCWSQSGCANNEKSCESALDSCDSKCGGN